MTITIKTCVEVACDVCGPDAILDRYDYMPHFDSIDYAVEQLTDAQWRISDDRARILCDRCAKYEDCTRNGHQMSTWQVSAVDGRLWRYCEHCDASYELADPRQTGEQLPDEAEWRWAR